MWDYTVESFGFIEFDTNKRFLMNFGFINIESNLVEKLGHVSTLNSSKDAGGHDGPLPILQF